MSEKNIKSFEELLKDPDWQITDENRIQLQDAPDLTRISDFESGKQTMFNIIIPEIT